MADPAVDDASEPEPPVAEGAAGAISDDERYRTVYRPKELQFTLRAVIFGCLIGSVLSAANLYTGFTIGFTYGASITASIALIMTLLDDASASEPITGPRESEAISKLCRHTEFRLFRRLGHRGTHACQAMIVGRLVDPGIGPRRQPSRASCWLRSSKPE